MPLDSSGLGALYRHRFEEPTRAAKEGVWKVLCRDFFSRYVAPGATVLDVGAGYCEFINHIAAGRRIAVDANPDLPAFAKPGVEVQVGDAQRLGFLEDGTVDVAFSSNFFEHLPSKTTLQELVKEIHRVLRPGGKLLVMGPNVKYLPGAYWDFFDHHLALTEKSVEELLHLGGFDVQEVLPRFLPYTVKSRLPKAPALVRWYLRLGWLAFPLFGKQFFVVAQKPAGTRAVRA